MEVDTKTVAAFIPELGRMVKLSSSKYDSMKSEGKAFHTKHPVTKLFRENQKLKEMVAGGLENE